MLRSLIVPGILIGLVSLPLILPTKPANQETPGNQQVMQTPAVSPTSPFQLASSSRVVGGTNGPTYNINRRSVSTQNSPAGVPFQATGAPIINPAGATGMSPTNRGAFAISPYQTAATPSPVYENGQVIGFAPDQFGGGSGGADPAAMGMTPDFGAAQTFSLPGTAQGPDLSAAPMSFIPVMNFAEIFRYDVSPGWIQQRWERVSTTPSSEQLRGYRVAVVTGTNSWDLHGSLTYYFDRNQKCQRITFRGWSGDPQRLIQLLEQQHNFQAQPSNQAGFYLAKHRRAFKGGLLMRHPAVMYSENRVQQVALLLEMNAKPSAFELSQDFISLIRGSVN